MTDARGRARGGDASSGSARRPRRRRSRPSRRSSPRPPASAGRARGRARPGCGTRWARTRAPSRRWPRRRAACASRARRYVDRVGAAALAVGARLRRAARRGRAALGDALGHGRRGRRPPRAPRSGRSSARRSRPGGRTASASAVGGAAGALDALAQDVLDGYRIPLGGVEARMSEFDGKVVLITGGGSGMGRAFALALAAEGARIAVCGRRPEPLEETVALVEAEGSEALATPADVRDPEPRSRPGSRPPTARFGAPRRARSTTPPATSSARPSTSRRTAGARSSTSSSTGRSTARPRSRKRMRDSGRGGAMLNVIASYAWTGNPGTAHSAAAKAGVWNLTKTLAVEWAPLRHPRQRHRARAARHRGRRREPLPDARRAATP